MLILKTIICGRHLGGIATLTSPLACRDYQRTRIWTKTERRGIQSVPRQRNVPCRQREGLREGEREKNTSGGTESSAEHNGRMGERGDKFRERSRLSARSSPTLIRAENEIFEPAISAANSITPAACTKSCSFLGPEIEKRQVLMRWWITGSALIADRWESLCRSLTRVPKLKVSYWILLQRGLWGSLEILNVDKPTHLYEHDMVCAAKYHWKRRWGK